MKKEKCKHIETTIVSSNTEEKYLCILKKCRKCNKYQYLVTKKGKHNLSHWFKL